MLSSATPPSGAAQPVRARRSGLIARLGLLLVSSVASVLLAEGLSRVVAPVPLHPRDTFLAVADSEVTEGDSAMVWLRPNLRTTHTEREFSVSVVTNSRGLRDREFLYEKPPGTRRVLSLGDSFAFGWGVEVEQSYAKVAESTLGPEWEVVSGAVPSWGTGDELDFLVTEGFRYEPDVVVVGFYENDIHDSWARNRYRIGPDGALLRTRPIEDDLAERTSFEGKWARSPIFRDICERGASVALPEATEAPRPSWWVSHSNLVRLARRAGSRLRRSNEPTEPGSYAAMREEENRLTAAILAEIARQCGERRIPLLVLLIPEKDRAARLRSPTAREQYAPALGDIEHSGATVVDLTPALRDAGIARTHFGHDLHINAEGHRVVARELVAAVRGCVEDRGR